MRAQCMAGLAVVVGCGLLAAEPAWAAVVRLGNGDQLTGRIVEERADLVTLEHEALGRISITASQITELVRDEPVDSSATSVPPAPAIAKGGPGEAEWTREVGLGYNLSSGNTVNEDLSGSVLLTRKTDRNEWTGKLDGEYGSDDHEMDTQRYGGSLRYAFSFGQDLEWFNFYKAEGSHDRFANVDGRVVLSSGLGHWFADREDWKAMAEVGLGWERTNFRSGTSDRNDPVLVPRAFAKKTFSGGLSISQELVVWPNLGDLSSEYRLRAETILDQPVAGGLSFRVSFVDEYEAEPGEGTDHNDVRLTSSLVYSF